MLSLSMNNTVGLFAGYYLVSWIGSSLLGMYVSTLGNSSLPLVALEQEKIVQEQPQVIDVDRYQIPPPVKTIVEEKLIKITEKITLEPPSASEIASQLTDEQILLIANAVKGSIKVENQVNEKVIVEKIMENPVIQNIITYYNTLVLRESQKESSSGKVDEEIVKKYEAIILDLRGEIEKIQLNMKELEKTRNEEMAKLIFQFKTESNENNAKLNERLEKLRAEFDELIENNGKLLMEKISLKMGLELNSHMQKLEARRSEVKTTTVSIDSISDDKIRAIVGEALATYDADKTGLVDYALEPAGGQILSTRCTEGYLGGTAVVSIFGVPLWNSYLNTPRTVITPGIVPGECWAFQNFPGFLVIKLSAPVKIEAFSYEHVSRNLIPNGKIDSAPKEFMVYGLHSEDDKDPVLIGKYHYDDTGKPLQFFYAENSGLTFGIIELRVISNHGNPNYTCLYRFRVHGSLSNDSR